MVFADIMIGALFVISLLAVLIVGIFSKDPWKKIAIIFSLYFALVGLVLWLSFYNINAWLPILIAGIFILFLAYIISQPSPREKMSVKKALFLSLGPVVILFIIGLIIGNIVGVPEQFVSENTFIIKDINAVKVERADIIASAKPVSYGNVDIFVVLDVGQTKGKSNNDLSYLLYGSKNVRENFYVNYPVCIAINLSDQAPIIVMPVVELSEDGKWYLTLNYPYNTIGESKTRVMNIDLYLYSEDVAKMKSFYCGSSYSKSPDRKIRLWPNE